MKKSVIKGSQNFEISHQDLLCFLEEAVFSQHYRALRAAIGDFKGKKLRTEID